MASVSQTGVVAVSGPCGDCGSAPEWGRRNAARCPTSEHPFKPPSRPVLSARRNSSMFPLALLTVHVHDLLLAAHALISAMNRFAMGNQMAKFSTTTLASSVIDSTPDTSNRLTVSGHGAGPTSPPRPNPRSPHFPETMHDRRIPRMDLGGQSHCADFPPPPLPRLPHPPAHRSCVPRILCTDYTSRP